MTQPQANFVCDLLRIVLTRGSAEASTLGLYRIFPEIPRPTMAEVRGIVTLTAVPPPVGFVGIQDHKSAEQILRECLNEVGLTYRYDYARQILIVTLQKKPKEDSAR